MRIALFGQFGAGNSGNDGSLEAMVEMLRATRPDAELVCICPNPAEVTARLGIAALPSWRQARGGKPGRMIDRAFLRMPSQFLYMAHAIDTLSGFDLFIVPGTGFLDDFQERALGWPLTIFRWTLAARLAGARPAFVSIGAGPIRHPLSRRLMGWSARLCDYRSYRDTASRDYMCKLGYGSMEDPVFPDLAFALSPPRTVPRQKGTRISVGVGVMAYSGWIRRHRDGQAIHEAYIAKMVEFVGWLLDEGYCVRFLTGDVQDQPALWTILRRLEVQMGRSEAGHISVQPITDLHELMEQIALTDIVVATRFHNVLCALKLARPVISLGYSEKNEHLLAQLGIAGMSQHVADFDLGALKRQFNDALSRRDAISRATGDAVARSRTELSIQNARLLGMMTKLEHDPQCQPDDIACVARPVRQQ